MKDKVCKELKWKNLEKFDLLLYIFRILLNIISSCKTERI